MDEANDQWHLDVTFCSLGLLHICIGGTTPEWPCSYGAQHDNRGSSVHIIPGVKMTNLILALLMSHTCSKFPDIFCISIWFLLGLQGEWSSFIFHPCEDLLNAVWPFNKLSEFKLYRRNKFIAAFLNVIAVTCIPPSNFLLGTKGFLNTHPDACRVFTYKPTSPLTLYLDRVAFESATKSFKVTWMPKPTLKFLRVPGSHSFCGNGGTNEWHNVQKN